MQKRTRTSPSDGNAKLPPLRDFFDKCYVLHSSEKYEQFLKELGAKKNVRVSAIKSKPRVTLSLHEDEYQLTTSYAELKDVTVKFKTGETVQRPRPGGYTAASTFYIVDNKLIEEQQFDDKTVMIERAFSRTTLTITMKINDVKCTRYYVISSSKHSIGTETSRRSSLWKMVTPDESKPAPEVESILEGVLMPETESEENVCF